MVSKSLCFLFVFLTLSLVAFVPELEAAINGARKPYKGKRFFQKERDFSVSRFIRTFLTLPFVCNNFTLLSKVLQRPFHAASNDFSRVEAKPAGYDEISFYSAAGNRFNGSLNIERTIQQMKKCLTH